MTQKYFLLAIMALALGGGTGAASALENPPVVRPNILPKPPVSQLIKRKGAEKPAPAPQ
jgi:hypothetical protein